MPKINFVGAAALLSQLDAVPGTLRFWGTSALDLFFCGKLQPGAHRIWYDGSLQDAVKLFDSVFFERRSDADFRAVDGEATYLCRVSESSSDMLPFFSLEQLSCDPFSNRFFLPLANEKQALKDLKNGILRLDAQQLRNPNGEFLLRYAALLSRYNWHNKPSLPNVGIDWQLTPSIEIQRFFLEEILSGPQANTALDLLFSVGLIQQLWPEVATMSGVSQSKEDHPEGDVWQHSLAALKHRKTSSLALSMAILLHDIGKPIAIPQNGRRFNNHADLGAKTAYRFMARLGFSSQLSSDVAWLVGHHMVPPALNTANMPFFSEVVEDSRFPLLLELFRCDVESTYRTAQPFYRVSSLAQRHRRWAKNPSQLYY